MLLYSIRFLLEAGDITSSMKVFTSFKEANYNVTEGLKIIKFAITEFIRLIIDDYLTGNPGIYFPMTSLLFFSS